MRTHLYRVLGLLFASVSLSAFSASATASPACSGDACESLTLSADGCSWKNASDKAIKFSLSDNVTTLFATILGPGEGFKQTKKESCVTSNPNSPHYQASFATLRKMPDAPDFSLKATPTTAASATTISSPKTPTPRAKPSPQQLAAIPSATTDAVTTVTPAATPQPPSTQTSFLTTTPKPRAKPDMPVPVETEPKPPVPTPAAQSLIAMPTQAEIDAGANPCGDACSEILFKTVDDCLWVQSQNPKPIMFQATIANRMVVVALEGASYKNSSDNPPSGAVAYHTRQRDPFQSASAGIPVYRAKLGDKSACITDKAQISHFVAVYKK